MKSHLRQILDEVCTNNEITFAPNFGLRQATQCYENGLDHVNLHTPQWRIQKIDKKKMTTFDQLVPVIGHILIVMDWPTTMIASHVTYKCPPISVMDAASNAQCIIAGGTLIAQSHFLANASSIPPCLHTWQFGNFWWKKARSLSNVHSQAHFRQGSRRVQFPRNQFGLH